MARKRTTGADSAAAAAPAPAREKRTVTRAKHAPAAVAKTEIAKPVANVSEIVPAPLQAAPLSVVQASYVPPQEEVAALAYSFWEARGYQGGSPEEDWLRAETELRTRGPIRA